MNDRISWRFWLAFAAVLAVVAVAETGVSDLPGGAARGAVAVVVAIAGSVAAVNLASWVVRPARDAQEARVLEMLARYPDLNAGPLARLTGIGTAQISVVLARLEQAGRVTSRWADEPYPRRRLYRATAGEEATR